KEAAAINEIALPVISGAHAVGKFVRLGKDGLVRGIESLFTVKKLAFACINRVNSAVLTAAQGDGLRECLPTVSPRRGHRASHARPLKGFISGLMTLAAWFIADVFNAGPGVEVVDCLGSIGSRPQSAGEQDTGNKRDRGDAEPPEPASC